MVLFGSLFEYDTEYLAYPKRDHNFDNHPSARVWEQKAHTG